MLDKKDEEKVREIVTETVVDALTSVMMPVLNDILVKQSEHDKKFERIEEKLEEIDLTVNRIETLQRSELNRVDDHEVRIGKLENKMV